MGRVFSTFANLWRGFVSAFVKSTAEANPEATIEGMIQKRLVQRQDLTMRAGRLRGRLLQVQSQYKEASADLNKVTTALQRAVATNNSAAGAALLRRKEVLREKVSGLKAQGEELESTDKQIVSDIRAFNAKIADMKYKLSIKSAQAKAARVTREILDQVNGLSIEGDEQAEQAAWDSFEAEIGASQIVSETDGNKTEREVRDLMRDAEQSASQDEFAALRAQFEATQGTHTAAVPVDTGEADSGKQA